MDIEYVTHASFKLDNGNKTLLVDPFYFFDEFLGSFICHFPPRELTPESLGRINYLYSSHIHPDHCHPQTLEKIRNQVEQVVLPNERNALVELYANAGFTSPRILKNGETISIDDGINITAYWDGTVDTALVVEMDGCTILHQNDCRLSPSTLKTIASRHKIDFAFLLYTSAQSLFPFILDRPRDELEALAQEREMGLLNYQVSCVEILKPRVVVPYSMTMTYSQESRMYVNSLWRFTPHTFCDALRERCPNINCIVMHPGDQIKFEHGQYEPVTKGRTKEYWGYSKEEYINNVSEYLSLNRDRLPQFQFGYAATSTSLLDVQMTNSVLYQPPQSIDNRIILLDVVGRESREALTIDFESQTVERGMPANASCIFLKITIPASLVEMLLKGEIDPFVALYTHEISFQLNNKTELEPEEEGMIYLDTMFFLFAKAPTHEIAETDGMRLARRGSPYL